MDGCILLGTFCGHQMCGMEELWQRAYTNYACWLGAACHRELMWTWREYTSTSSTSTTHCDDWVGKVLHTRRSKKKCAIHENKDNQEICVSIYISFFSNAICLRGGTRQCISQSDILILKVVYEVNRGEDLLWQRPKAVHYTFCQNQILVYIWSNLVYFILIIYYIN